MNKQPYAIRLFYDGGIFLYTLINNEYSFHEALYKGPIVWRIDEFKWSFEGCTELTNSTLSQWHFFESYEEAIAFAILEKI